VKHAYFIGIGGIGMSAIARYLKDKSVQVSGYDRTSTALTKTLEEEGMDIHYTEDVDALPKQIDIVIYTPAIPESHVEYQYLLSTEIPVMKRSEALGLISQSYQTIAVAGTHGKTSTSTVLAHLLVESGIDSINFLGGIHRDWNSNYSYGESGWLVAEADEFDRSFLQLHPQIAVILSMDADHLDIYGSHSEMIATYEQFTTQIKVGGTLIIQHGISDAFTNEWKSNMDKRSIEIITFGSPDADLWIESWNGAGFDTDVNAKIEGRPTSWKWNIPGYYNASNASIGWFIAKKLGCEDRILAKAIKNYGGVKRRIECLYESEEGILIDDYAHHPEELRAVIGAIVQLYPDKSLTGIFQPHLYTRTRDHFEGFAETLSLLDTAYVLPIYPARELPIDGITSEMIVVQMTIENATAVGHDQLEIEVKKKEHEVIITLGAGNLERHHEMLLKLLKNQTND